MEQLPLLLGYKCGLWLGEAFGLTWDCINFEAETLTLDKQLLWHVQVTMQIYQHLTKKMSEEGAHLLDAF